MSKFELQFCYTVDASALVEAESLDEVWENAEKWWESGKLQERLVSASDFEPLHIKRKGA